MKSGSKFVASNGCFEWWCFVAFVPRWFTQVSRSVHPSSLHLSCVGSKRGRKKVTKKGTSCCKVTLNNINVITVNKESSTTWSHSSLVSSWCSSVQQVTGSPSVSLWLLCVKERPWWGYKMSWLGDFLHRELPHILLVGLLVEDAGGVKEMELVNWVGSSEQEKTKKKKTPLQRN